MNISITNSARNKIQNLVAEGELDNPEIRLVSGCAGCAGLSVGISIYDTRQEDDYVEEVEWVSICIEQDSKEYVKGTTIDFEENEFGGNFILSNEYGSSVCFL